MTALLLLGVVVLVLIAAVAWTQLHGTLWAVHFSSSSLSSWETCSGDLRTIASTPNRWGLLPVEIYRPHEVRLIPREVGDVRYLEPSDPPTPTACLLARWRAWVAREAPWLIG